VRIPFLIVASAVTVACSDGPTAPLDHDFTIGVGETAHISGTDLSLKFVVVTEDSRCPATVECVWAGNGQIQVAASSGGQTSTLYFNTAQGPNEIVTGGYRVRLTALLPARSGFAPIPAGSYRATFVVTQSGTVCTEEARPALSIGLADSVTGRSTGFSNVSIVARDGAYADSVTQATYPAAPFNGPVSLAYEHRGTYTVTVRADGYAPWQRSGVVVTGDQCHVATVSLLARLAN